MPVHILIFYRNFLALNECHIGLGVNAMHTARVLRANGILCDVFGVRQPLDIEPYLAKHPEATHVVIEAIWVPAPTILKWMRTYPRVKFICRSHSQIGFLQVEAAAVSLFRDYLLLQDGDLTFHAAGNSRRFCSWIQSVYNSFCDYLPNLYDIGRPNRKNWQPHNHKLLRVSSFGSLRLLKNHSTAAGAAQTLAKSKNCDLEFWISVNREEQGKGVLNMLRNMFSGLKWAKLVENPWQRWAEFRHTIAMMDVSLQPSFTESFNLVSADAVAEGIPVVTSSAIEWLPSWCHADVDDANDIARVAGNQLGNPVLQSESLAYLENYVTSGVAVWKRFLAKTSLVQQAV